MVALGETPGRLREIVARLTPEQMASGSVPEKWTAAQLLVHLAQSECAFWRPHPGDHTLRLLGAGGGG